VQPQSVDVATFPANGLVHHCDVIIAVTISHLHVIHRHRIFDRVHTFDGDTRASVSMDAVCRNG
jgi:hypothetical protein